MTDDAVIPFQDAGTAFNYIIGVTTSQSPVLPPWSVYKTQFYF